MHLHKSFSPLNNRIANSFTLSAVSVFSALLSSSSFQNACNHKYKHRQIRFLIVEYGIKNYLKLADGKFSMFYWYNHSLFVIKYFTVCFVEARWSCMQFIQKHMNSIMCALFFSFHSSLSNSFNSFVCVTIYLLFTCELVLNVVVVFCMLFICVSFRCV